MDTIKINSWDTERALTLKIGDEIVVVGDPGRWLGTIPHFGQRRKAKVTRIMGRVAAPYLECQIEGSSEKLCFDDRGHERGMKYNQAHIEACDPVNEAAIAAEAKRAEEARQIVRDLVHALPHASQIEKLVWTRPDLVPVLRELLAKIAEGAKKPAV